MKYIEKEGFIEGDTYMDSQHDQGLPLLGENEWEGKNLSHEQR
jgi:hypothetical protein